VLAAEHLLDLAGLHLLIERVERLGEFNIDRLAGIGPFEQHSEIVALLPERCDERAVLLQPPAALQDSLRFRLVFPELRGGRASFEAGQFFFGARRFKDSSADPRRVC
jgi:hypothetical protein